MKYNIERLENAGVYINKLKAAGGGAKSKQWLQIKADIMGCPVILLSVDEAGTTGAAMLAAVAAGLYKTVDESIGHFVHEREEIKPSENEQRIYLENFERYKKARENSNIY